MVIELTLKSDSKVTLETKPQNSFILALKVLFLLLKSAPKVTLRAKPGRLQNYNICFCTEETRSLPQFFSLTYPLQVTKNTDGHNGRTAHRNLGSTIHPNPIHSHCILSVSTYETRIPTTWLELETIL